MATMARCAVRTYNTSDHQKLVDGLNEDGVVCIKNAFSMEDMEEFTTAYHQCWERTIERAVDPSQGPWLWRIFPGLDGKERPAFSDGPKQYHRVPFKALSKSDVRAVDNSEGWITRFGPGRFDFGFGFMDTVLGADKLIKPKSVAPLVKAALGDEHEWTSYAGGLPAAGACDAGGWHKDTYNLWKDKSGCSSEMPPFLFTMVVPLTPMSDEDGGTEFRLGSHHLSEEESGCRPIGTADLAVGDALLFDGRIKHRGGARQKTVGARDALYVVFHKAWYQEPDLPAEAPVCTVEEVPAHIAAVIEAEDPWLTTRKPSGRMQMMQSLAAHREKSGFVLLGLGVGLAIGMLAGRRRQC